jgi:hypothetical protein
MMMMTRTLSLLVAIALLGGCGTPVSPTPVAPTSTLPPVTLPPPEILLAYSWEAGQGGGSITPFTASRAGTVLVEADWGSSTTDVDIYLAVGRCTAFPSGKTPPACSLIALANGRGKPERIEAQVTPGEYSLIEIVAVALRDDTGSVRVTLR